jgi:NAD(P) transhydrogenase subunit alpha
MHAGATSCVGAALGWSRGRGAGAALLAVFVGFEVVSKVSSTLHTPLMSGANAIHGIILIGAIIVAGQAESVLVLVIALIAVLLATVNLVGGFVVTDRMLEMFRGRKAPAAASTKGDDQ